VLVEFQHALSLTVLIDARNVLRSRWPNFAEDELVDLISAWAKEEGVEPVIVFDGPAPADAIGTGAESADDWIARRAAELEEPFWLVTSDRELRERAGGRAERIIGGGAFASLLRGEG
jgi:predicted RNA-binding protein with PIN domain